MKIELHYAVGYEVFCEIDDAIKDAVYYATNKAP